MTGHDDDLSPWNDDPLVRALRGPGTGDELGERGRVHGGLPGRPARGAHPDRLPAACAVAGTAPRWRWHRRRGRHRAGRRCRRSSRVHPEPPRPRAAGGPRRARPGRRPGTRSPPARSATQEPAAADGPSGELDESAARRPTETRLGPVGSPSDSPSSAPTKAPSDAPTETPSDGRARRPPRHRPPLPTETPAVALRRRPSPSPAPRHRAGPDEQVPLTGIRVRHGHPRCRGQPVDAAAARRRVVGLRRPW